MTAPKPPRRTRERILEASLALFNAEGAPGVTTAHIADELSISPGNLYYHFRNKEQIVAELFAAFERDVSRLLPGGDAGPSDVEDLWLVLHLLLERMHAYRFLFRDLPELTAANRRLAMQVASLLGAIETALGALCRGMIAAGAMRASEAELGALVRNAVVIATFWLSFVRVAHPRDEAPPDLDRAAYQVLALVAPYLDTASRALVERLAAQYV